jgi:hypothetical protein
MAKRVGETAKRAKRVGKTGQPELRELYGGRPNQCTVQADPLFPLFPHRRDAEVSQRAQRKNFEVRPGLNTVQLSERHGELKLTAALQLAVWSLGIPGGGLTIRRSLTSCPTASASSDVGQDGILRADC